MYEALYVLKLVGLFLLYGIGSFYLLWLFFLAVMNLALAKKEGKLSRTALILGTPALLVGYIIDMFVQFTFANVVFLELPEETTVSGRVKRLANTNDAYEDYGPNWRKARAVWFREVLLKPFDRTGGHG